MTKNSYEIPKGFSAIIVLTVLDTNKSVEIGWDIISHDIHLIKS